MKKVFLSCILFLSLCPFSNKSFGGITIEKFGGGENGYDKITETHSDNSHFLGCDDPGNSACTWVTKPSLRTTVNTYDVDNVVLQVESFIALGQLAGTYLLDGEIPVSWTATTFHHYQIFIDYSEI